MKVTEFTRLENPHTPVIAVVSFYVPEWEMYLNDCRYIRKKTGGYFIGYPSKRVMRENADTQYYPYYNFSKERNDWFQSESQKAVQEYLKENQE